MSMDLEDQLSRMHTDIDCRDCPLFRVECDPPSGVDNCFVPNSSLSGGDERKRT
jgi:hypothetical protein